jgi:hypothetical protein
MRSLFLSHIQRFVMLLNEYQKTNKPKTIIYCVERTLCPATLTEYNDLIWVAFTK